MRRIDGGAQAVHRSVFADVHGVVILSLGFPEICKSGFIHCGRTDRPGMVYVPLLETKSELGPETWDVGSRRLKERKRLGFRGIIEVVVHTELV